MRLGIDLGGTSIRVGAVENEELRGLERAPTPAEGPRDEVLERIYTLIDRFAGETIEHIGVGVPSIVDVEEGVVYDVQNIPSWTEVPLGSLLADRYGVPVRVQNDANCFALAEYTFGTARGHSPMVGLVLGTGFAGGIVIDGRLYSGPNCGAGEFGTMPYRDSIYEHYCAGLFFERAYDTTGEEAYTRVQEGDPEAQSMFDELGTHLGRAIQNVLYAIDPSHIVLGGSVSQAYPHFQEAMWDELQNFAFPRVLDNLTFTLSDLEHPGVLGAAALGYEHGESDVLR